MADGYPARDRPGQPTTQVPTALNARLEMVRENLSGALNMLAELRVRLGLLEPPNVKKDAPPPPGAAGTVMDLLAQSARLTALLRETLEQVG